MRDEMSGIAMDHAEGTWLELTFTRSTHKESLKKSLAVPFGRRSRLSRGALRIVIEFQQSQGVTDLVFFAQVLIGSRLNLSQEMAIELLSGPRSVVQVQSLGIHFGQKFKFFSGQECDVAWI